MEEIHQDSDNNDMVDTQGVETNDTMARSRSRNSSSSGTETEKRNRKHNKKQNQHQKMTLDGIDSREEGIVQRDDDSLFLQLTPWIVTAVTLAIRVFYVINPQNWWMIHPDEVYQSTEIAHIEVYGYGFRSYDFSPPESPEGDVTGYRKMTLEADMYGFRSPLFPYFYVLVSWLVHLAEGHVKPFVLWRVAHVSVSSLLPLAVYRYVVKLYKSPRHASLATILVASSLHLNVLGTHCLLHSFLAPLTFFGLSLLGDNGHDDDDDNVANGENEFTSRELVTRNRNGYPAVQMDTYGDDLFNNNNNTNNNNNNSNNHNRNNNGIVKDKSKSNQASEDRSENHISNGKSAYPHVNGKVDPKTLQNGVNGHHRQARNNKGVVKNKKSYPNLILAGFIAVLVCYIRPDTVIIYMVNFVMCSRLRQKIFGVDLVFMIFGGMIGLLLGIGADFAFYGWGVVSPVNWVNFNVIKGFSKTMFGHMGMWYYCQHFLLDDTGTLILSVFCVCLFVVVSMKARDESSANDNQKNDSSSVKSCYQNYSFISSVSSLFICIIPFVIYSLCGHKETRFIHDVMVLTFIFFAKAISDLRFLVESSSSYKTATWAILALFTCSQWQSYPDHTSNKSWVFQKSEGMQDINACIDFIASQHDVTGVFYDRNLFMTGGMSLLHRDVTIMSLLEDGFFEFGPLSRRNYTKNGELFSGKGSNKKIVKSINEFTSASNYVALSNPRGAARAIIEKPVYNYIVLKKDLRFVDVGFDDVFTFGSSRVLKRKLDRQSEYGLQGILERIPLGSNATVLLQEGDVLLFMNQYKEAERRFVHALALDERLVQAYQPLAVCYNRLGNDKAAGAVMAKCRSMFDATACTTRRKITRL